MIYFRIMERVIATLLLSVSFLSCNQAQTSTDLWRSAAEQYENADYRGALINYQLVEAEMVSSELYFNLGNCYYHLDSVAQSILYFEKAIKLNPRDRAARENLSLALSKIEDPIPAIEEFFLRRWVNGMSNVIPPFGWGLVCIALLWFTVWMLVRSVKRDTLRQDKFRLGVPVAFFLFCLFGSYMAFQNQMDSDYAIVMEPIEVKVAPDSLSAITRSVAAGEKVLIIDQLDAYYKVRFVNYEHGWLPKPVLRRI